MATANAVASDSLGNVYLMGETFGSLGGANQGSLDPFVIGFDRNGTATWGGQPGTPEPDYGMAGATDSRDHVYVAGYSNSSAVARVTAFDPAGSVLWQDQLPAMTFATGAAADAGNNLYMVGYVKGVLPGNVSHGGYDAFLVKYGPDGPQ